MIQDEHGLLVHGDGAQTLGISVLEQNEKEVFTDAIKNQEQDEKEDQNSDPKRIESEIEEDYEI